MSDDIKPGYTRDSMDCLFNGGHLWHYVGQVATCDFCGNVIGRSKEALDE